MAVYARTGWFRPDLHGTANAGTVTTGFRPVAVMLWAQDPGSYPVQQTDIVARAAGFAARRPDGSVETRLRISDYFGGSDTGGVMLAQTTLYESPPPPQPAGSLLLALEPLAVTAFTEQGFTWKADSGYAALAWAWLAIGGDDVTAAVRRVAVPSGSADGTFTVSGLGFLPKAAIALPARSGQMMDGVGAFVPGGGGFGVVQSGANGVSPTRATAALGTMLEFRYPTSTTTSAVAARVKLDAAGVGTLTFRHDAASDGSAEMLVLALGGDGLAARAASQTVSATTPMSLAGDGLGAARAVLAATGYGFSGYPTHLTMGFAGSAGPQWTETFAWHNAIATNNATVKAQPGSKGLDAVLGLPALGSSSTNRQFRVFYLWNDHLLVNKGGAPTIGAIVLAEALRPNVLGTAVATVAAFASATLAGGTSLVQAAGLPSEALATTTATATELTTALLLGSAESVAASTAGFAADATGFGAAVTLTPTPVVAGATVIGAVGNATPFAGVTPDAVAAAGLAEATRLTDPVQALPAVTAVAASLSEATALTAGLLLAAESLAAAEAQGFIWYDYPEIVAAGGNDVPGTVNYLPDPSYETGIGWEVVSGSGTASTDAWAGSRSLAWSMGTANRTLRIETARGLGFADGATYVGSVRVKGPLDSVQARLEAVYADASVQSGTEAAVAAGADWTLVTTPPLATDGAKTLDHLRLRLNNTAAGTVLVDGAQVERGTAPTGWCSGALGAPAGAWLGNPDASPSWRQTIRVVNAARTVAEAETVAPVAPVGAEGGRGRAEREEDGARAAARYGAPFGLTGGRGGALRVEARLYRATWDNRFLEDLSEWVVSGRVEMDTNRDVTWSLDATLLADGWSRLTPYLDWVAPYLTITYPNGTVSQGQLGLYLVMESPRSWREYGSTVQLTAVDPLWLLNSQGLPSTLAAVGFSTGKSDFVRSLLAGAVLTQGDVAGSQANPRRRYQIPTVTLSNGQPSGFGPGVEFEAGMSRLRAINEVLLSAGCTPLYTTRTGVFTTRRLDTTLNDRQPARTYAANAPAGWNLENRTDRGLFGDVIDAIDTSPYGDGLQNEVLLVNDSPWSPMQVRYRITDADNRRSLLGGTTGRNRRNTRTVTSRFMDDAAEAARVARAIAESLSLRNETARLRVVPEPHLELAREVVGLAVFDAEQRPVLTGRWAVQRASYGFTPGDAWMELEVARVRPISGVAEAYVPGYAMAAAAGFGGGGRMER